LKIILTNNKNEIKNIICQKEVEIELNGELSAHIKN
jgi:hypothetical protein